MGFTRKPGQISKVILTHDLPDEIMAPLPEAVLARFPEMKEWMDSNQQKWQEAKEAHLRHLQEITDAINKLP